MKKEGNGGKRRICQKQICNHISKVQVTTEKLKLLWVKRTFGFYTRNQIFCLYFQERSSYRLISCQEKQKKKIWKYWIIKLFLGVAEMISKRTTFQYSIKCFLYSSMVLLNTRKFCNSMQKCCKDDKSLLIYIVSYLHRTSSKIVVCVQCFVQFPNKICLSL